MSRGGNRRKYQEARITIGSTGTSGNTADSEAAQSHDAVTYYINITTATAGNITFTIQTSADDGATWATLATAETTGDTGAITATGARHLSSNAPIGVRTRLVYTIVTGPFAFTVDPIYQKGAGVF